MDFTKYNYNKAQATPLQYDAGLRSFMLGIYNYMTAALVITAIVSMFASSSETIMSAMYIMKGGTIQGIKGLGYLVVFAPLAMVFLFSSMANKISLQNMQLLFWTYASLLGLSLSSIFIVYTGESIVRTFLITASVFGAMSLYGYTTKNDLTKFGSFLMMGLFGIIITSVVNMFLHSNAIQFAMSALSVIIFTGLTAYNTQSMKSIYYNNFSDDAVQNGKLAIMGALNLYMDFINIFISLLRFVGDRRS